MNQIWVVNVLIGDICDKLNIPHPTSGGWMESYLEYLKEETDDEVTVVSTLNIKIKIELQVERIKYIVLPLGSINSINDSNKKSNEYIKTICKSERPDIIILWGTEYSLGRYVDFKIPTVIYMQGILKAISKYYKGGLTNWEIIKNVSMRDIVKIDWINMQAKKIEMRAKNERYLIQNAYGIITENEWCRALCNSINPNLKVEYCQLNIKKEFLESKWKIGNADKMTLITSASEYPMKGLHILLMAMKIIKIKYPEITLKVTGMKSKLEKTFFERLKVNGYYKYINNKIKKLGLIRNVEFLGRVKQEKLVDELVKARCFILPSAIENHSSSLKEAMCIGLPCIASSVGGIPEFASSFRNVILYRYEEFEVLAEYIIRVIENDELAKSLSKNAREDMEKIYLNDNVNIRLKKSIKNILKAYKEQL